MSNRGSPIAADYYCVSCNLAKVVSKTTILVEDTRPVVLQNFPSSDFVLLLFGGAIHPFPHPSLFPVEYVLTRIRRSGVLHRSLLKRRCLAEKE